jgi:sugar transferase (PEP-CTERM/EpsH1 system associated)
MKILFVANRVPYPPFRGDKLKIFNLARRLAVKHEIYLITFAESEDDFKYTAELEKIFKEVHIIRLPLWQSYLNCLLAVFTKTPLQVAYFKSAAMHKCIYTFLSKHKVDVIHTQHLRMAQFTADIQLPRILDLPDAFSLYWKRRIENQKHRVRKFVEKIEFRRLYQFEANITKRFHLGLVCSREDLEYMQTEHGLTNLDLLRNGVDLDTFHSEGHDYSNNKILLFTGNMDYAPNVDAVIYFVAEVWPKIVLKCPDISFIIAGQRPVKQVLELQSDKIKITGFVPDLKVMYQQASVVVSPLRFGAGTQNKVLEAMAMGIPVVSGSIGFGGLEIEQGEGVFLETNPIDFANKVVALLRSETLRNETGRKGLNIARDKFSWDKISLDLERYCQATSL